MHSEGRMASTSRAWKTCSSSTPKTPDPKRPVVCFDESPGPAHRRGARADPGRAGPGSNVYDYEYLPQRHRRSSSSSSTCTGPWRKRQGAPSAARPRLRRVHARSRRCPLSRRRAHPRRAGQPVDPLARRALPGLRARRSQTHAAPPRVPLHPEARQLAQHGGDRDRRAARPSAWIAGSTTQTGSAAKSPLGSDSEMPPAPASNGCSQPTKPVTKLGRTYPHTPKES